MSELLSEISETVQSPRARAFLTSALEFVRPHHLALGLRVSRLSITHVEVVVPQQKPEYGENYGIDPGVFITAASLGAQLLLRRLDQPDLGAVMIRDAHFQALSPLNSELRGRLELTKLTQEALRAELKKKGSSELELVMSFFDESDRRAADCSILYLCRAADQISWTGTSKGSDESSSNPS